MLCLRRNIVGWRYYGELKQDIGYILRKLCERKGIEIIEAEACPDHIHMLISIPPKDECITSYGISERKEFIDDI